MTLYFKRIVGGEESQIDTKTDNLKSRSISARKGYNNRLKTPNGLRGHMWALMNSST